LSNVTRWWWIRHAPVSHLNGVIYGDSDPDADLSDSAPFRALASRLPRPAVWIISNLKRTRQTAEAIAAGGYQLPRQLIVDARLREQGFGEWHGQRHADHDARRTDPFVGIWNCAPDVVPPGGESFVHLLARTRSAIEDITQRYRGQDIICVAHGGTIRAALALALRLQPVDALAFTIGNVSLSRIDCRHSDNPAAPAWRVRAVNS